jgi:hypothetical protein
MEHAQFDLLVVVLFGPTKLVLAAVLRLVSDGGVQFNEVYVANVTVQMLVIRVIFFVLLQVLGVVEGLIAVLESAWNTVWCSHSGGDVGSCKDVAV